MVDEKRELQCNMWNFGSKGQPSGDFLVAFVFRQDILTYLGQCFFSHFIQIQDDERKMPRKF